MKKRIVALVMAGAMIGAMSLAGCGSNGPTPVAPSGETAEVNETSTPQEDGSVDEAETSLLWMQTAAM